MNPSKTIFTGGSGLLGSEFKKLVPDALYPSSSEFNVTDYSQMEKYVQQHPCELLIHAAAFTSPPLIEKNPLKAVEVNIIGTANVVRLCMQIGARLIYISTDYVFQGDKGNYAESDPMNPVNKYAWSKLGGECAVRLYDKSLIIRTTFGPNVFPYEKAFVDQWTSRESVSVIARKIATVLQHEITGVLHVGGSRRTVLDYAKSLEPVRQIGGLSIRDVKFAVPVDTSLNCTRYQKQIERQNKPRV